MNDESRHMFYVKRVKCSCTKTVSQRMFPSCFYSKPWAFNPIEKSLNLFVEETVTTVTHLQSISKNVPNWTFTLNSKRSIGLEVEFVFQKGEPFKEANQQRRQENSSQISFSLMSLLSTTITDLKSCISPSWHEESSWQ